VTARQVAWSRRWASGLPALIVLLLLLVGGGVGRLADSPALASAETALAAAPAATQPAAAPRADLRLLVKRTGHWATGQVVAAGSVPALAVAPAAGWWAVAGAAMPATCGARGEVYRGRAPPVAA
jgi:hypothetical protein